MCEEGCFQSGVCYRHLAAHLGLFATAFVRLLAATFSHRSQLLFSFSAGSRANCPSALRCPGLINYPGHVLPGLFYVPALRACFTCLVTETPRARQAGASHLSLHRLPGGTLYRRGALERVVNRSLALKPATCMPCCACRTGLAFR